MVTKRNPLPPDITESIIELSKELSPPAIAKRFGVAPSAVYKVLAVYEFEQTKVAKIKQVADRINQRLKVGVAVW